MNKGILSGIGAYLMWGLFPLYFKALQSVPAFEIILHRIVWSFIFIAIVITVRREWRSLRLAVSSRHILTIYLLTALLLASNWLLYIWAINSDHVVEASLGYFINPLLSVAMGVVLLREKLRGGQWLAVGLAAVGVTYLAIRLGQPPWISLGLAFTFGLYGLVKKVAPLGSLQGLAVETAALFLPALGLLTFYAIRGSGAFGAQGTGLSLLLAGSGLATSLPLLLFASAARSIPLTMVGILQYITPTLQFMLGVVVFHEPFTPAEQVGFGIIWGALALFTFFTYRAQLTPA